jgi:hypothetical protein
MRLKWTRTDLPGAKDDFTGRDPDAPRAYGRIRYTGYVMPADRWRWSCSDGIVSLGSGYEGSAREAAEKAEDAYFARRG